MIRITNSVAETIKAGADFATGLDKNAIVLINGEMGAGKTHFVKGMAQALGITETVTSPTFAIVNEYSNEYGKLYHFDLFRISSHDDLYAVGFYDYIGKGVVAVEWAENIAGLESEFERCYTVNIAADGENGRTISIEDFST